MSLETGAMATLATPGALRLRRGLLLAAAAAALVVSGVSIARTVQTFFVLDFPVTWLAGAVRVETVPAGSSADLAGLRAGERIVTIDGRPVEILTDPLYVLAAGGFSELTVVQADGAVRRVRYAAPRPRPDPVYLARSAVAILGLLCAVFVVLRTRRPEASSLLLLAVAALLLAAIPHRVAAAAPALGVLHRAAGAGIAFFLVRFYALFPGRRRPSRTLDGLTVVAMVLAAGSALDPGGEAWWDTFSGVLRGVFVLSLLTVTVLQVRRWREAARVARVRRQIEWAALGMIVGLAPYAGLVLLPRWAGIAFEPFAWLAVLPMVAIPLGFLAALLEYHLWDLEPISRDALSATLVVVTGGLIFATANQLLVTYGSGLGSVRNLLAFAAGVVVVLLLQPARRSVGAFLDRWLYHGRPNPRALLTQTARELAQVADPQVLLERLGEALSEGLELELVATYLRERGNELQRVTGDGSELPRTLPLAVVGQPFPQPTEEPLAAAGYARRIALERAGTVHGLVYLGLRRGIFPLGREGTEVVQAFAAQAALALESSRLLDEVRQQAEEYRILHANTRRIIESSAAGILVCDASGRILSANARAVDLFGGPRAELVARPLAELVSLPEHWIPHLPLHAVNAEAETLLDPPRRVVMAVSVLEFDSGRFNGRVVVLQDVTEVRQLQDRLREQERLAGLGRLASGLAHEINTPLTGIASFAQMLGELTDETDPRSELVSKLVDQSFRVSRIVANLHEAVRGRSGERAVLDLAALGRAAAADAARAAGPGSDRVQVDPAEPVMVWATTGAVELAVANLVRNALQASPEGEPVRVTIAPVGPWGEVWVDDRGPGIPEELREKVFEPFFTTRSGRGGTGLGLAITRDMIQQLGGEVSLQPSPAGGTRAIIRLPRWEPSVTSSSSTTSPSSRTS